MKNTRAPFWTASRLSLLVALGLLVMFGLGAATGGSLVFDRQEAVAADKSIKEHPHEQTWPQSYRDTTCGEWLDDMKPDEKYVAATEILGGFSWSASSRVPPANAKAFRASLTEACHKDIGRGVVHTAWEMYQDRPGEWD